jgi:outer membrane protein insertion porin family
MNFELVFPILPQLQALNGALFYDIGNVFAQRSDFGFSDLDHALGIGLRYRTPLGPVRLELGWNPVVPEDESRFLVFITIGNIF